MRTLYLSVCLSLVICASGQDVQVSTTNNFRPFHDIVAGIREQPLKRQYDFLLRLSKGLMTEDYAAFTGQRNVPNFGHLARELIAQQEFDVMRALLKERELAPYNYYTVAEQLAVRLDAGAFELLVTNSSVNIPPPKDDTAYKSGQDFVSGEGIPEYSALSLSHYLGSEAYGERAETHLIKILKDHKRTGVRAFAALALGDSKSPRVIKPLEEAVSDKARVYCIQCGEDYVGQYAEKALEKIRRNP
jgi:hypothetical protein